MLMLLAAEEIDPTKVTPGAGGLVVFIALLVAGYFLYRSLRKQLNRVDFEEAPEKPDERA
ncbi:MAG: hypothetical protein U0R28_09560 [Candidatus Nanopelagicales bacterium]